MFAWCPLIFGDGEPENLRQLVKNRENTATQIRVGLISIENTLIPLLDVNFLALF